MEIVGHRLPMIAAVLVAGIGLSAATVGGCALTGRATVVSAADASERYAGFTKSFFNFFRVYWRQMQHIVPVAIERRDMLLHNMLTSLVFTRLFFVQCRVFLF